MDVRSIKDKVKTRFKISFYVIKRYFSPDLRRARA